MRSRKPKLQSVRNLFFVVVVVESSRFQNVVSENAQFFVDDKKKPLGKKIESSQSSKEEETRRMIQPTWHTLGCVDGLRWRRKQRRSTMTDRPPNARKKKIVDEKEKCDRQRKRKKNVSRSVRRNKRIQSLNHHWSINRQRAIVAVPVVNDPSGKTNERLHRPRRPLERILAVVNLMEKKSTWECRVRFFFLWTLFSFFFMCFFLFCAFFM